MNLYEYITKNKSVVNTLFKQGLLSSSVINNYSIYQFYLDALEADNSKSMSIELVRIRYDISIKTIYQIIKQFSESI